MKNIIIGILALTVGQTLTAQNLSFGPTAGVGHSWITEADNVKIKPSFNIGGTLVYSFVPHWGIGADIRFSFMEGVRSKVEQGDNYVETSLNTAYLRVPMKVYYFFGEYGDKVRPKLFAGPAVGFLLAAKTRVETKVGSSTNTTKNDVKDDLESFDFGVVAGAGVNVRLQQNIWLNLDLAYNNGFMDISDGGNDSYNRNIGINVGVTFPLGTVK